MARPLRIEFPGAFYHVMNRGLERREVFRDSEDYKRFLKYLGSLYPQFRFLIHSYCLMPNHYHLFIETPQGNLKRLMQNLNSRYTQYFNRRYKRVGPLFQGRYKAILIDKKSYSLEISRYIHLNPVKAKMVKRPEEYEWSSYRLFFRKENKEPFLETDWLLSQMSPNDSKAHGAFRRFTFEGLKQTWDPFEEAKGGILLGKEEFSDRIKKEHVPKKKDGSVSRLREVQKSFETEDFEREIEKWSPEAQLKRKLLLYCLKQFTSLKLKEIGDKCGGMKPVAVSQAVRRIKLDCVKNQGVSQIVNKLEVTFCQI